jgi:hypothetical protein
LKRSIGFWAAKAGKADCDLIVLKWPLAFPIFAEKRIHLPRNDQGLNHVPVTTRVRPLAGH